MKMHVDIGSSLCKSNTLVHARQEKHRLHRPGLHAAEAGELLLASVRILGLLTHRSHGQVTATTHANSSTSLQLSGNSSTSIRINGKYRKFVFGPSACVCKFVLHLRIYRIYRTFVRNYPAIVRGPHTGRLAVSCSTLNPSGLNEGLRSRACEYLPLVSHCSR